MNFFEAIKEGPKVTREAWAANAAYVRLEANALFWGSKDHPEQSFVPSHSDLLATDWRVIE